MTFFWGKGTDPTGIKQSSIAIVHSTFMLSDGLFALSLSSCLDEQLAYLCKKYTFLLNSFLYHLSFMFKPLTESEKS